MNASWHTGDRQRAPRAALPLLLLLALALPAMEAAAQPKFQLQRTKRVSTPVCVQLYGGYNGMSEPSDKLQDSYENTALTAWGGVMIGIKTRVAIDTLVLPIWGGLDLYYHRTVKRWLEDVRTVYYASDSSRVRADERLSSYGFHLYASIALFPTLYLEFGGGAQYLYARTDVDSEVHGLFQPVWVATGMAGLDITLLRYDHGGINGDFRLVKGFGEYGSLHFQSLLVFSFNF